MARTKDFDEEEVLKKAIYLFWDKGYNATSMQDLVDGLGISRSSLYDTFGDKRQLYLKALSTYQQQSGQVFCTIINHAANAKTAIRHLLQYVAHTLEADDQRKGCFMLNAGVELANHDNAVNDIICQKEQEFEEVFLNVIKDGQTRKEIPAGKDARALARFLSNTVKGMQVSGRSATDENYFNDIIDTALMVLD